MMVESVTLVPLRRVAEPDAEIVGDDGLTRAQRDELALEHLATYGRRALSAEEKRDVAARRAARH
jgi:hypothetical protein